MGFMGPLPELDCVAWLIMATMPAKAGALTEVPPTAPKLPSLARNPAEQLVGFAGVAPKEAWEQINMESWFGDAVKEASGTSRWPSAGVMLFRLCQAGFEKTVLTPPPLAESPFPAATDATVSFHAISGM